MPRTTVPAADLLPADLDDPYDRGWHASVVAVLEVLRRTADEDTDEALVSAVRTRVDRAAGDRHAGDFARGWRDGWDNTADWLAEATGGKTPAHIDVRDHLIHMVEVYADGTCEEWAWGALLDGDQRLPTRLGPLRRLMRRR